MKRTRIRKEAKKRAGYTKCQLRELDRLAREVVLARDNHQCQYGVSTNEPCGGRLEWAHVDSRRFRTTRWLPDNAMILCSRHHFLWHDRPVMMSDWWMRTFPERKQIVSRASAGKPPDYDLMKRGLELELKMYTGGKQFPVMEYQYAQLEREPLVRFVETTPEGGRKVGKILSLGTIRTRKSGSARVAAASESVSRRLGEKSEF